MADTVDFALEGEYVELNQLLKLAGLCDSGGAGAATPAAASNSRGKRRSRCCCSSASVTTTRPPRKLRRVDIEEQPDSTSSTARASHQGSGRCDGVDRVMDEAVGLGPPS